MTSSRNMGDYPKKSAKKTSFSYRVIHLVGILLILISNFGPFLKPTPAYAQSSNSGRVLDKQNELYTPATFSHPQPRKIEHVIQGQSSSGMPNFTYICFGDGIHGTNCGGSSFIPNGWSSREETYPLRAGINVEAHVICQITENCPQTVTIYYSIDVNVSWERCAIYCNIQNWLFSPIVTMSSKTRELVITQQPGGLMIGDFVYRNVRVQDSPCGQQTDHADCTHSLTGAVTAYKEPRDADSVVYKLFLPFSITDVGDTLTYGITPTYEYGVYFTATPNMDDLTNDCHCSFSHGAQTQGFAGTSVNTRTGEFSYTVPDISMQTSAGPLTFEHSYSSAPGSDPSLSSERGWTNNHDMHLTFTEGLEGDFDEVVLVDGPDKFRFYISNAGGYTPEPTVTATLTKNADTVVTYTLYTQDQSVYVFDELGKLLTWSNPQGKIINYSYNSSGQLEHVGADENTRYLNFTYNSQEQLIQVTDSASRSISFDYDENGDLTEYVDVLGQTWQYEYSNNHELTVIKDPSEGVVLQNVYDTSGRVVAQRDGLSNQTVALQYNSDGTTVITDALGNESVHTYNNLGILTSQTDSLQADRQIEYDMHYRPVKITDPNGGVTTLIWSANGNNLVSVTNAEENQTLITYDTLNNPVEVEDSLGYLTTYEYENTLLTKVVDALYGETNYTYTTDGQLESVTNPLGQATTYVYDVHGQQTSMSDSLGHTWSYTYDSVGRLTDTIDPLGRVTHTDYDAAGRVLQTVRNYDPNRPPNDQNLYNVITEYEYDVYGNQISVTDTFGRSTHYEYDSAHRLVETNDAEDNSTINTYNAANQLVSTSDALGRITEYEYDDTGRLLLTTNPMGGETATSYNPDGTTASTTDALGRVTQYAYDSMKRVVTTTLPNGSSTHNEYDDSGNLISTTDAAGNSTTYEYDALGRMIHQIDPLDGVTENYYDEVGNLLQTINPLGGTTTYAYNDLNQLVLITDALGNETSYEYDDMGRRSAIVNAEGQRTEYVYDLLDRVVEVIDPLGHTVSTSYNALGQVVSRTDANDVTTSFEYDDLGRLIHQTDALNGVTTYVYDAVGNKTSVTDPNEHTTIFTYDDLNRVVSVTDPNENVTITTYDSMGNVLFTKDALQQVTSYTYNSSNQQTKVSDPLGNETRYLYNSSGNVALKTDANGIVTRYDYDALGRLLKVTENFQAGISADTYTNVATEYTYDANGNRLTITDGNEHTTTFAYDDLNRLESETDPLGHIWRYTYDGLGNRISMTDANNAITLYGYDDAGRLVSIDYPGSQADVEFEYDAGGRRTRMVDASGSTSWVYDELNRPISVTDPFSKTVEYGYDATGNRIGITYPNNQTVAYTYDAANQLTSVKDWDEQSTYYSYDPTGRLSQVNRPNGVSSTYMYDMTGRLLSLRHANSGLTLASYQYSYDNVGNRIQAIEDVEQAGIPVTATPTFSLTPTITDTLTPWWTETAAPTDTITPEILPTATEGEQPTPTSTELSALPETSTFTPEVLPSNTETPTETLPPTETETATLTPTLTQELTSTETPSPSIILDEFDETDLSSDWEWYTPKSGPTYSLTAVPGSLRMSLPAGDGFEHIGDVDNAPQLRRADLGDGDWAIESRLESVSAASDAGYWAALEVGFEGLDQIWFGMVDDGYLKVYRLSEGEHYAVDVELPISLRIEKHDDQYDFLYKSDSDTGWTALPSAIYEGTPTYVGLIGRGFDTGSAEMTMDWSYFRLEQWTVSSTPTPTVTPTDTPSGLPFTEIVEDAFDGPTLGAGWEWYVPKSGPTYSLTAVPGSLRMSLPAGDGFEHIGDVDNAPQLRRSDLGDGDWAIETRLEDVSAASDAGYWAALEVGFEGADQIWFGMVNDGYLKVYRLSEGEHYAVDVELPISLRIEKHDDQYDFLYKSDSDTEWTALPSAIYEGGPNYVGLIGRGFDTGSAEMTMDWSYFRLERWPYTPSTLTPTPADVTATATATPTPLPYSETMDDAFDGPALETGWEWYVPKTGPTYSLSAVPGSLRMSLPAGDSFEHFGETDEAPQLRRSDLGDGDWAIEARLENVSAASDAGYWAALEVGFDDADQIWFGMVDDGYLKVYRLSEGEHYAVDVELPVSLRVEKHGATYSFLYKSDSDTGWTAIPSANYEGIPAYVGLIGRGFVTGSAEMTMDWSYFHLERWPNSPSTPTPTVTATETLTPTATQTNTPTITPTRTATPTLVIPSGPLTIQYEYDDLYRLTQADYSNGWYYHYTYDATGNRLTAENQYSTASYQYDDANRLVNSDGMAYVWDANGNLLNDGVNTYTYDPANRLVQMSNDRSLEVTYTYNGQGDRLGQTINGVPIHYTLDLTSGLTQVLDDGAHTYTYGLGRIAQINTTSEYFLGDALGSVRQMTGASGAITFAQNYDPYGVVTTSAGTSKSGYGFTGEQMDVNGLTYLRARYYDAQNGRFLSRDTWRGNIYSPLSLNRWMYVEGNPVNLLDPSGMLACTDSMDPECVLRVNELKEKAQQIKDAVSLGNLLPVEGFAQFTDFALNKFDDDIRGSVWAITLVINGFDANSYFPVAAQAYFGGSNYSQFIGYDWLPYKDASCADIKDYYKDVGGGDWVCSERGDWSREYWDKTANQAYHGWYYAAETFFEGPGTASFANGYHEGKAPFDEIPVNGPPPISGRTAQDNALSLKMMELGYLLYLRYIDSMVYYFPGQCPPDNNDLPINLQYTTIGAWIRTNLRDYSGNRGR